jgi:hypothetical protein
MQDYPPWHLSAREQAIIDARGASLSLPGWLPSDLRLISLSFKVIVYMHLTRSAAWHYVFAGFFQTPGQQEALRALIDYMAAVTVANCDIVETPSAVRRRAKMRTLKAQGVLVLNLLEREFPRNLLVYCFHNLLHVPDMLLRWNNVRNYWAFFMER